MAEGDNIDNNDFLEQDGENSESMNTGNDFLDEKESGEKSREARDAKNAAEDLKKNMIEKALDNLRNKIGAAFEKADVAEETKEKLGRFFDKSKEELTDDKFSVYEGPIKWLMKTNRFKNRSESVVENIAESASKIENEIKNWKDETNPVARSLLKIIRWIMGTEK